jgi:hypothetical protein
MKKSLFKNLPIGATFTCRGVTYQKLDYFSAVKVNTGSINAFSQYHTVNWHRNIQPEQYQSINVWE